MLGFCCSSRLLFVHQPPSSSCSTFHLISSSGSLVLSPPWFHCCLLDSTVACPSMSVIPGPTAYVPCPVSPCNFPVRLSLKRFNSPGSSVPACSVVMRTAFCDRT
ncbi:hypothetical protein CHARACLAT_031478 [Characodon lateralis]|uniref:Secreted protein n=1 Tax=Characodon lateralis TaxID=208331 RepID=A0ABU7D290_9TELE|nr:hypothetical protein [Characodon lateralis]